MNLTDKAFNTSAKPGVDPLYFVLKLLLERPWFSRVWTLQGSVLPSKLKKVQVLCGEKSMTWETFQYTFGIIKDLKLDHYRPMQIAIGTHELVQRYILIERLDSNESRAVKLSEIRKMQGGEKWKNKPFSTICTVLTVFRSKECTDQRDKIFALYSIF